MNNVAYPDHDYISCATSVNDRCSISPSVMSDANNSDPLIQGLERDMQSMSTGFSTEELRNGFSSSSDFNVDMLASSLWSDEDEDKPHTTMIDSQAKGKRQVGEGSCQPLMCVGPGWSPEKRIKSVAKQVLPEHLQRVSAWPVVLQHTEGTNKPTKTNGFGRTSLPISLAHFLSHASLRQRTSATGTESPKSNYNNSAPTRHRRVSRKSHGSRDFPSASEGILDSPLACTKKENESQESNYINDTAVSSSNSPKPVFLKFEVAGVPYIGKCVPVEFLEIPSPTVSGTDSDSSIAGIRWTGVSEVVSDTNISDVSNGSASSTDSDTRWNQPIDVKNLFANEKRLFDSVLEESIADSESCAENLDYSVDANDHQPNRESFVEHIRKKLILTGDKSRTPKQYNLPEGEEKEKYQRELANKRAKEYNARERKYRLLIAAEFTEVENRNKELTKQHQQLLSMRKFCQEIYDQYKEHLPPLQFES